MSFFSKFKSPKKELSFSENVQHLLELKQWKKLVEIGDRVVDVIIHHSWEGYGIAYLLAKICDKTEDKALIEKVIIYLITMLLQERSLDIQGGSLNESSPEWDSYIARKIFILEILQFICKKDSSGEMSDILNKFLTEKAGPSVKAALRIREKLSAKKIGNILNDESLRHGGVFLSERDLEKKLFFRYRDIERL